jgi:hypothetical protein
VVAAACAAAIIGLIPSGGVVVRQA